MLGIGTRIPDSRRQIVELEGILQKEKEEFEVCLQFLYLNFSYRNFIKQAALMMASVIFAFEIQSCISAFA